MLQLGADDLEVEVRPLRSPQLRRGRVILEAHEAEEALAERDAVDEVHPAAREPARKAFRGMRALRRGLAAGAAAVLARLHVKQVRVLRRLVSEHLDRVVNLLHGLFLFALPGG